MENRFALRYAYVHFTYIRVFLNLYSKWALWFLSEWSSAVSLLFRAIYVACGLSLSTPSPAAPVSWKYDGTDRK